MNAKVLILILSLFALNGCGNSEHPVQTAAPTAPNEHDEHGDASEGQVELSTEQVTTAGITLVQAGPAAIRETLPVYGVVAPNAEHVRDIVARFPGVIRSVTKKIGDDVHRGDTLATIESNESLQTYPVVAPLNGVVTARNANPGEQSAEKVLFTIADLSTVWVELSLFPRDLGKVRVGQLARVTSSDSESSAEGKIVYVAPFGSSTNQTLTARVLLDNAEHRWAPGLYVNAEIILAETPAPLAVRNEALQTLADDTVVFVRNEHGFEARTVRTSRSDSQWTELTAGLAAGETYAAANSFIVKAELGKGSSEHDH